MPKKTIGIHISPNDDASRPSTVLLNQKLFNKWKIPDTLILRIGSLKHTVNTAPRLNTKGLRFDASFARQLGLISGIRLNAWYKPRSKELILGPLMGVLMSRSSEKHPEQPFASNTEFCQELSEAMQMKGGFVYFFTPAEVERRDVLIQGWFYQKGWKKASFPLPNVIYNRLTTRKLENMATIQQLFLEAQTIHQSHVFNERYLDKAEVFEVLQQDASCSGYLPESDRFTKVAQLKKYVDKYHTVFLKPIRGSLGKGIIRITKMRDQSYHCCFTSAGGSKQIIYSKLSNFFHAYKGKFRIERYQIQQGLDLITVDNHPVDFRALVQKRSLGTWKITSIVARKAGNDQFVSNIARGGKLLKVTEALQMSKLSNKQQVSALGQLRSAAIQIANSLDERLTEHFGELGIDLAVDTSGRVWLLEVNSKPSKNDATPLAADRIRPSVKHLIAYVHHLHFSNRHES